MTFGPGSTYGDEGAAADTAYYILTVLGIVVTLAALVAWVVYENRQLVCTWLGSGPERRFPPPSTRPAGHAGPRRLGGLRWSTTAAASDRSSFPRSRRT